MRKIEDSLADAMSDLEACCNMKVPNIGGIVEESIGVNIKVIKLITKVLPWCENFIGTTHGVNKESYGGENELLGGIGKGIFF